jgi:DNA polymerase III delta prime subunit
MSERLHEILENIGHHAFLIVGNREQSFETLRHGLRERVSKEKIHSADVWSRAYESLNIDDAREIKEVQGTRPNGSRRHVLISLMTIQSEAQNSLLKLFEEPSSDTTFYVCAEATEIFLPTVLSRFYVVEFADGMTAKEKIEERKGKEKGGVPMKEFLSSPIARRIELLEPIISEKDKSAAEDFLNRLEQSLKDLSVKMTVGQAGIFEEIFSARRFIRSRAPSIKMILEHLSGIIPTLKK